MSGADRSGEFFSQLEETFQDLADPERAPGMAKYMRNHFPFLGIPSPLVKETARDLLIQYPLTVSDLPTLWRKCWEAAPREFQYFVYPCGLKFLKKLDPSFLPLLESLITQKSWWDSVDFLAPKLAGNILLRFPDQIPEFPDRWIESENIWLQRSAILFQLDYKNHTDSARLFRYILRRADSREFFVQKAAGWALRQYGKTNPTAVRDFVDSHRLPALTMREGTRRLLNL